MEMVVEQRGQKRVSARDRVEVAGEVEIDVLHRQHLRVSTARSAALHPEHRAETRLANAQERVRADPAEGLREADRGRRLPFSGGCWIDARDEDEFPANRAGCYVEWDLRLVFAVEVQLIGVEADLLCDVDDRPERRTLSNLDVRQAHQVLHYA